MNELTFVNIMKRLLLGSAIFAGFFQAVQGAETPNAAIEATFLSSIRQLTFDGLRSGEGYFSHDGQRMVFQSEREPGNPFYQIYLLDLASGDTQRISPGYGKTTCAWLHRDGRQVLFASTHDDSETKQKQVDELALRAKNQERRYQWDYDPQYELYVKELADNSLTRLTHALGYDAEGSYSPDGSQIAFASNRAAYATELDADQAAELERDPSRWMDIYIMDADGSNPRRLTDADGYDGGPFFSPDGNRLCWRRFSADGATAEIMTMNTDGSDARQITRMNAMSWAPYYHPSGQYLIFTTNVHGFGNFELYLVDVSGKSPPVRVTGTDGFDGLPVFTPDGKQLAWTSGRNASKHSQIYLSDWNHAAALAALGLTVTPSLGVQTAESAEPDAAPVPPATEETVRAAASQALRTSSTDFVPQDILRHVDFLCRPEMEGRLTGTEGEKLATAYVAAFFDSLGLQAAGDGGSWYQPFDFTAGVDLGKDNQLRWGKQEYTVDKQWRPLAFSATGEVVATPVVFAGYGIIAPADPDPKEGQQDEYDSYVHLDVKDKWVMVLRYLPEEITPERRQHLARYSSLRYKAMVARDKGAKGLIVVTGPRTVANDRLVRLQFDGSLAGASIPVISVQDDLAESWLKTADVPLASVQEKLDSGQPVMGTPLTSVELAAKIEIEKVRREGRNVLARLPASQTSADGTTATIVVGAHVDHLGKGGGGSSLAREDESGQIHHGADDNASGVAAVLEIAQYLAHQRKEGKLDTRRDILFAAWSGEELGLLGSSHFVKHLADSLSKDLPTNGSNQVAHASEDSPHATDTPSVTDSIYPTIAACINLDMVGRLQDKLVVQGVGSSSIWTSEIEQRNVVVGLSLSLQNDSYLPTDASAFFMRGVPILSAFTGSHQDYHTPRDTPEKLNYDATAQVAHFMGLVTRGIVLRDELPDYIPQQKPDDQQRRANLRAYLGTIPDYAETETKGVKLSGVARDGPAEKGGVKGGDVVVSLAGKKIDNIYDYTYAIEALKVGQEVEVVVRRSGKRITLKVTPGSRE